MMIKQTVLMLILSSCQKSSKSLCKKSPQNLQKLLSYPQGVDNSARDSDISGTFRLPKVIFQAPISG